MPVTIKTKRRPGKGAPGPVYPKKLHPPMAPEQKAALQRVERALKEKEARRIQEAHKKSRYTDYVVKADSDFEGGKRR